MASQEHLQRLEENEGSGTSSSTSGEENSSDDREGEDRNEEEEEGEDEEETSSDNGAMMEAEKPKPAPTSVAVPSPSAPAPQPKVGLPTPARKSLHSKMRIKLKLPTQANIKKSRALPSSSQASSVDDGEVRAMVVDSDEAGEEDAVIATAVPEGTADAKTRLTETKGTASTVSSSGKPAKKRRTLSSNKQIRLPPIASPGLLMLPPPSNQGTVHQRQNLVDLRREAETAGGFVTPRSVFDTTMAAAGYTVEERTQRPHRGSSVQRTVADLFDSNVKLALRFPELVPEDLLNYKTGKERKEEMSLPDLLIQQLEIQKPETTKEQDTSRTNGGDTGKRRRRACTFDDMVPVTLTVPYPENYIKSRLQYILQVQSREASIIAWQAAQEQLEIRLEQQLDGASADDKGQPTNPITIPPIPEPPFPPRINDLDGFRKADQYSDQKHPLYPPRGKENLVAHLDKECFHITDGTYFGLQSNFVADPNFVGANAPGVASISSSSGGCLATASASVSTSGGSTASGSMTNFLTLAFQNVNVSQSTKSEVRNVNGSQSTSNEVTSSIKGSGAASMTVSSAAPSPVDSKQPDSVPMIPSEDLRKIMEAGGDMADSFKNCIIRAAVHASRSGSQEQSFVAPNGVRYPCISEAFSSCAGMKPCLRCQSSEQGAYHCRLKRYHKENDCDGDGNSFVKLAPLFSVPLDTLLSTNGTS
jgi:hypothetical protein